MKYDYHIIVIGAGSAGLTIASGASGLGAKVALLEKHKMGGDCLNYGCVPSKTFLRTAHLADDIKRAKDFGLESNYYKPDLKKIMARVRSVVAEIAPHDSQERFEGLGVDVFRGDTKFIADHTVQTGDRTITAKNIVIATGSMARIPNLPGLDKVDYLTNKTIFDLEKLPNHLIVIGGGPIGLELGQGFRHLGSKVSIIDSSDRLFPKDDPEVWETMNEVFVKDEIDLHLSTKIEKVDKVNEEITLTLLHDNKIIKISGDALLVSAGRVPDTEGLDICKAGIKLDDRGYVITSADMRTNKRHIFAAGDVTGPYQFTHMAGHQGGKVVPNAILKISQKASYSGVPWTTYTKPEVAHVGYTQPWAESLGIYGDNIVVPLNGNDRAKADDDRHGFLKLIMNKKKRLIGATLVSEKAGEMMPVASLAIAKKLKGTAFASFIISYPTESEIFQRASFDLLKTSFKPWMKKLIDLLFLR